MKDEYAEDDDFAKVCEELFDRHRQEHYAFKEGYLLMHGRLCAPKPLRAKVLDECHAPPYAGHRGIGVIVKAVEHYFYWPSLRQDVDKFVRR